MLPEVIEKIIYDYFTYKCYLCKNMTTTKLYTYKKNIVCAKCWCRFVKGF